jgi:EAL domain-containing protein (putative c-di-GMP-specific phosphodiesterase class I)
MSPNVRQRAVRFSLHGRALDATFHRYHDVEYPDQIRGEILSGPGGGVNAEAYFGSLSSAEHLEVLQWQFALKERLSIECGAHCSVNVHNSIIVDVDQRNAFLNLVRRYPAPMTLEFTETFPMPTASISNGLLHELRLMGHQTALDDFGSGLNGASVITDYEFDIIKIDRSMVTDIATRLEKQRALQHLAQLLTVLSIQHVVEGVETLESFDALRAMGFTTFQGYLFSMPELVGDLLAPAADVVMPMASGLNF